MMEAQETLLALLRSALWGVPCIMESRPDWDKVMKLAEQQTVNGLLAEAVMHVPEEFRPDAAARLKLHSKVTRIYQSHALLNRKVAEVKRIMDEEGIRSVLFKGQGLALNYPNPLSRQCGDIDLYVGERNFLKAMDIMEPDKEHDIRKYAHLKHFNTDSEGVEIEIHRVACILPGRRTDRLFREWTAEQLEKSELRTAVIGGAEINLPPVVFDAIFILYHAWHHFMTGGIGLRQLCDWSLYLHRFHNELDIDELAGNIDRFGLRRAWGIFASVAVKKLGLPASECPLYTGEYDSRADKVMEFIWEEGNFGKYSESRKTLRPKGHFAGKFHSFRMNTSRVARIIAISPSEVLKSWTSYFMNGMRNVFVRLG